MFGDIEIRGSRRIVDDVYLTGCALREKAWA